MKLIVWLIVLYKMFAVGINNPVVYHLTQIPLNIAYWKSRTNRQLYSNPVSQHNERASQSLKDITKQLNLTPVMFNHKSTFSVNILGCKKRNLSNNWKQSYISGNTFSDNKKGLDSVRHDSFYISLNRSRNVNSISALSSNHRRLFEQQIRTFKTERSIKVESMRGSSISSRIKDIFPLEGASSTILGKTNLAHKFLKTENLSEEEAVKLKVAFAEGYAAGQSKHTRAVKLLKALQTFLLVVLIILGGVMVMASASGTVFKLQLGNQVEVDAQEIDITFDDVKGVDEAKQELKEIVEFLKNPEKFSALGGKLPKGALLVGPPGTGKTLLARAVAGEAGVPFFHAAGSEFDEILVGQGARRVRDLFSAAKSRAPCVIFIDEIDAVGGKRTNSVLHPYANQTINQLLSEMDGFHQNEGVIVLGATNRREDLDKALLRPGRFDVEVHVNVPDFTGRKEILELYLKKIQCRDIDIDLMARGTTGFTGADLENMVNLAALKAAIDNAKFVSMKDLENARDKVIMGPARKSRIPDEEANEITAYHEGGHVLVAHYTKDSHPIHKVTIIPRGPSLGHTAYIPKKENYHTRKSELLATIDTMMGGRAAEELIFGPDRITSGAASDLKQATAIATNMVKEWGMSEKVGLRTFDSKDGSLINVNELSPSTTEAVDQEIKKILHDSYERAKAILKSHAKEHKQLAEALLKYETLEADDVKAILSPRKDSADRL